MAKRTRVPIVLLTGFLGSGKTTLLSQWLREPPFERAIAIVNELGEVGLDDRLARSAMTASILMENGCVCCAGGDDLASVLEGLFWDRLHRRIPEFSMVVIETTGLADPRPILDLIAQRALLAERYRVAGVIATLNAASGARQLADFEEARAQIDAAGLAILTKTDVAEEGAQAEARAAVAQRRPDLPILASQHGGLCATVALAALSTVAAPRADAGAARDAVHTPGVASAFADLPTRLERTVLERTLTELAAELGPKLLRVKGLARFGASADWRVVQMAADGALDVRPFDGDVGTARAGLTLIVREAPASAIAARLRARLLSKPLRLADAR